mmetsp:Transcript_7094/g.13932  ORF Transcript_7094/g.13932 Transcript_7094/m.13932 type:complete len:86 (+) Transcript_7094:2646-2903(+)
MLPVPCCGQGRVCVQSVKEGDRQESSFPATVQSVVILTGMPQHNTSFFLRSFVPCESNKIPFVKKKRRGAMAGEGDAKCFLSATV